MFLAETNRLKNLLHLSFLGRVSAADLQRSAEEVDALLADLTPGFVLLTDLSRLEAMDVACRAEIGRVMDICQKRGVGRIVRVIPEPSKDIGFNILSIFHYKPGKRMITCETLVEAERHLGG
jgi:hypothetical protein